MRSPPGLIELRSDNAAGAAPEIVDAVVEANVGSAAAYGDDEITSRLHEMVRRVFEHPSATVFPVASGTAANALSLSAMTPPWGAVLCHPSAHIMRSEGGATSMYSGGAVMVGVGGADFTIDPVLLAEHLDGVAWGDPHASQPAVLSLTVPSDYGTLTSPEHIGALAAIARHYDMRVHLDGARLANAVAAAGVSPAELTWRSGVDVVSFGFIKNGGLSCDAIVCFDPELAEAYRYRTKRAGHVASKMRFQSAQLVRHLQDGLWLALAGTANAAMARLAAGLTTQGFELVARADVNMAFVRVGPGQADAMEASGLVFHRIAADVVRFVTSWQTSLDEVDEVLDRLGSLRA